MSGNRAAKLDMHQASLFRLRKGAIALRRSPTLWIDLIWSVVGLPVGAVLLLVRMVRIHGATQMLGFVLALAGVVLARRVGSASSQSVTFI